MQRDIRYIFVEGNIGAGKSSLIGRIEASLRTKLAQYGELVTVAEPVEAWTSVGGPGGPNLLAAFYQDKARNATLFQSHALVTRIAAIRKRIDEVPGNGRVYVLCERSIYTDYLIFVRALQEEGAITALEAAVYKSWWHFWVDLLYPGTVAGVVYLRAEPTRCATHMRVRDRAEESAVPVSYLERLGELHEAAIAEPGTWRGAPRLILNVSEIGNIPGDDAAAETNAEHIYRFIQTSAGI